MKCDYMGQVFSDDVKNIFILAKKLQLADEADNAELLWRKCVITLAQHDGEDVLKLFYGDSVYDCIDTLDNAIAAAYITRCAIDVYDAMRETNPVNAATKQWARKDKKDSNRELKNFFRWLQRQNRPVSNRDAMQFKGALRAILSGNIKFKVSDSLASYTLINIIKLIVNGSVTVTDTGELK